LGSEYAQSNSSEQYLALLVLNNVSIPSENKRIIAMNCNAVSILARLLCEDVSCHLMAIILVNLTFADADLRRELVNPNSHMQLVDALSFAFVVSMQDESFENTMAGNHANPRELLRSTMERLNLDRNLAANPQFPETARWCICALKNLTRPSKDPLAAHAVTDSGIVPLLLKILTVRGDYPDRNDAKNEPSMWESNSLQDAALFTILNLATSQPARHYLKEVDAVHTLSGITDFTKNDSEDNVPEDSNYKVEQFQCLKARMALAYIVGGDGHYGQAKMRNGAYPDESVLLIIDSEGSKLEELLANVLHQRAKEGEGGYSAATFTIKGVLFAIRCLLTNNLNQSTIVTSIGPRLNCLLFKALAQHSMARILTIDAEAAEHAAFSLYLLSNYCFFQNAFLSTDIFNLSVKILTSYLHMENITPAGQHAADQLLLRLPYLQHADLDLFYDGSQKEDYNLDEDLSQLAMNIHVERRICGAEPLQVIFNRPILRRRAPKKNEELSWNLAEESNLSNGNGPQKGSRQIQVYPNALLAVQDLSFGSTKVRHMDAIDDVLIANNIANSADGEKTESYNFMWNWQDAAEEMARMQQLKGKSGGGLKGLLGKMKSQRLDDNEPFSIFGLKCGVPCASGNGVLMDDDDTLTTLETRQSQKRYPGKF